MSNEESHDHRVSEQRVAFRKRREEGHVCIPVPVGNYVSNPEALDALRDLLYASGSGFPENILKRERFEIRWKREEVLGLIPRDKSEFRYLEGEYPLVG